MNWDSVAEFKSACQQILDDDVYMERRENHMGMCMWCKRLKCRMEKYGQFAICIANLTRGPSSTKSSIDQDFVKAYHTVVQHENFDEKNPHEINKKELTHLPHCVFLLKKNWLAAMKESEESDGDTQPFTQGETDSHEESNEDTIVPNANTQPFTQIDTTSSRKRKFQDALRGSGKGRG